MLMTIIEGFFSVTLPLVATIVLSQRQTQRIIENSNSQTLKLLHEIRKVQEDTTCLLKKVRDTQERMVKVQEDTTCMLRKMQKVQEDMACTLKKVKDMQERMVKVQEDITCLLRKLDFGFKANALMHGWRRLDGITPEEARKLPEPNLYDESLGICYFKAPE